VVDKESAQGRETRDFPEVKKPVDELHRPAQCTGIQFGLYQYREFTVERRLGLHEGQMCK
jgi:hypothetical protein